MHNRDLIVVPTFSFTLTFVVHTDPIPVSELLRSFTNLPPLDLGIHTTAKVFLRSSGFLTLLGFLDTSNLYLSDLLSGKS